MRLVVTILAFLPCTLFASDVPLSTGAVIHSPSVTGWSQIRAYWAGEQVEIHWQGIPGEETAYFAVERSTDGQSFELLGGFRCTEAMAQQAHFSFTDPQPHRTIAYRVKMVQHDGSITYSRVAFLTNPSPLLIYPNPVQDRLTLDLGTLDATDLTVSLYDMNGRLALEAKLDQLPGQPEAQLNLAQLPAGTYMLRLSDGQQVWHQRLLKP